MGAMHLSDYMAQRGLSDQDVAAAIGKDRASVSRYRRKKIRPGWRAMKRIFEFSGGLVTPDDFLAAQREAAE